MGLFSRRARDDFADWERLAVKEFARAGRRGEVIRDPDDPYNTQLATEVGVFGFANLYIALAAAAPRDRTQVARRHVAGLAHVLDDGDPDLDDPEVLASLRARVIAEDVRQLLAVEYARPLAPGLLEVLCVDLPTSVQILSDTLLEGQDVDELFRIGRANLRLEGFERSELLPGVDVLEGPSLFVGSQILRPGFADEVVGPAPSGWVFAIPDRHTLAIHVVAGAESVVPISRLAQLTGTIDRDSRPGGLVSASVYFTDGRDIQRISVQDGEGTWHIAAEGAFLAAIDPGSADPDGDPGHQAPGL